MQRQLPARLPDCEQNHLKTAFSWIWVNILTLIIAIFYLEKTPEM